MNPRETDDSTMLTATKPRMNSCRDSGDDQSREIEIRSRDAIKIHGQNAPQEKLKRGKIKKIKGPEWIAFEQKHLPPEDCEYALQTVHNQACRSESGSRATA